MMTLESKPKTRWLFAILFAVCPLLFGSQTVAQETAAKIAGSNDAGLKATRPMTFKPKLLIVDSNEGIDIVDVDRDGTLDLISGRNWYKGPEFVARPLRLLKDWNGYVESNGEHAYDVDQDGWPDVISGSYLPTKVYWYRNPGKERLGYGHVWEERLLVDTKLSDNEATFLHDLNGDGKPEWITNSYQIKNPVVAWEIELIASGDKNAAASESASNVDSDSQGESNETSQGIKIKRHQLGVGGNTHGMGFGDINNDGREDIVIATGWYERPEGDPFAGVWKFHADWEFLHASCPMLIRDLNGDGRNDLIWGRGHDYGLFWWEGMGEQDGKLQFKKHLIDETYSQIHTIHFADLDQDGTDELIAGKRVRAHNGSDPGAQEVPCMYYYRWDAKAKKFDRFPIEEGHVGTGLQIRTADLNDDNLLDIAVSGKDGTWILFQEK